MPPLIFIIKVVQMFEKLLVQVEIKYPRHIIQHKLIKLIKNYTLKNIYINKNTENKLVIVC